MPVKRNRIKVASPPPIPAPRPAFEESFSQLAPVCRHDFSRHPASFSSLDQRLSIVSLLLRIDEGYERRKYSPASKHVLEQVYPRLLQLEAHMPFTRGDVYFLVQRAHEGASLSRTPRTALSTL